MIFSDNRHQTESEDSIVIKKLTLFLILILLMPPVLPAEDIAVFECSTTVKPNVLFLFDTSLSMKNLDAKVEEILDYDHNKFDWETSMEYPISDPHRIRYWIAGRWVKTGLLAFMNTEHYDDITCQEALDNLQIGIHDGKLNEYNGSCGGMAAIGKFATQNYLNYLNYVDNVTNSINWGTGVDEDVNAEGADELDLKRYNKNRDYYNYYGAGLGYGEYAEGDKIYSKGVKENKWAPVPLIGQHSVSDVGCINAKEDLENNGWTSQRIWLILNHGCIDAFEDEDGAEALPQIVVTGNFLNYRDMRFSRRYAGIRAVWKIVQARHQEARFGLMQFDLGQVWNPIDQFSTWNQQGGDLSVPCNAATYPYEPSTDPHLQLFKNNLFGRFSRMANENNHPQQYNQPLNFGYTGYFFDDLKSTPLAESLVEAGLYFSGGQSWFNDYNFDDPSFFDDTHTKTSGAPSNSYESPIQCPTQGNHIILITDGTPRNDFGFGEGTCDKIIDTDFKTYNEGTSYASGNEFNRIGNCGVGDDCSDDTSCGSAAVELGPLIHSPTQQRWLDNVAGYLHDKDLSPLEDQQSVSTHVITFRFDDNAKQDKNLMDATAAKGGTTVAINAKNEEDLVTAINEVLKGIIMTGTFSSAVTPVRQDDLIYSGDKTFLTSFQCGDGTRGIGNIKNYHRNGRRIQGINASTGTLDDLINGNDINDNIRDMWWERDNDPESDQKPAEGVAYVLWKQLTEIISADATLDEELAAVSGTNGRQIYSSADTTGNELVKTIKELAITDNLPIKDATGTPMAGEALKRFLVNGIYGAGLDWPLGDIVHSDIVITEIPDYSSPSTTKAPYMFAGANDGMLHCFNADTGKEEWGFIPPDFINEKLYPLASTYHTWFVDGKITIFSDMLFFNDNGNQITDPEDPNITLKIRSPKFLIFGERRGGDYYHLLNIKDIATTGKPLYIKGLNDADGGQSWCEPRLCRVKDGDDIKTGFLVGGGYDLKYDNRAYEKDANDPPKGRYIAIYDIETGEQIRTKIGAGTTGIIQESVIAARINDIDHDKDRIFSTIMAGDLGGNIYRFNADASGDWNGYKLFTCPKAITIIIPDPDIPDATKTIDVPQKLFYAPILSTNTGSGNNMLFFGTGDRENPKEVETNCIYGVEDTPEGGLTDNNLTEFQLTLSDADQIIDGKTYRYYNVTPISNPDDPKGWFFKLPDNLPDSLRGEKVISEPIILGEILIMATNLPADTTADTESGPCEKKGCDSGTGRVYIINTSMSNFSVMSFCTGTTDPMPQPKIVFDKDTGKVLISTGDGGLYDPKISVLNGLYWRNNANE